MKRVMVITHAGGSPYHGPNMRWYYLALALRPLGVDVEIVSSSNFHKYIDPPFVRRGFESTSFDAVTYHWIRTQPYQSRGLRQVVNQVEFVFGCYRAARHLVDRQPDVVIASSPHPLVTFPAVSIAKRCNARVLFEVRDLWPEILLELGNFSRLHPYILALKAAERHGVISAESVLSVKPGDFDYFASEYGLPKERFSYVPNGFLQSDQSHGTTSEVTQLRGQYDFVCGYVGAISAYYRLSDFVELAKRFKSRSGVGFMVIGKGDHVEILKRQAKEECISNLHFIKPIPKSAVPSAIASFDVCYVGLQDIGIHRYGISCNKIYEYMAAGKPILGSYRAGYDPVASAECGIVVSPGDYEKLAIGLDRLIDSPALRRKFGARARKYFARNHDFRVVARKFVDEFLPGIEQAQVSSDV